MSIKTILTGVAGVFLLAASAVASPASAAVLLGKTVQLDFYYPNTSSPYERPPRDNIVGTTGSEVFEGYIWATPADTSLNVTTPGYGGFFTSTSFNGVRLFDAYDTVAAFTSVTIDALTNVAGFDASRITWDADNIWLNFQGLTFTSDFMVQVDITAAGGTGVPEPASWALMIAGFGMVGGAMRRRSYCLAA